MDMISKATAVPLMDVVKAIHPCGESAPAASSRIDRRHVLAGLGWGGLIAPLVATTQFFASCSQGSAQGAEPAVKLKVVDGTVAEAGPRLERDGGFAPLRLAAGEAQTVAIHNGLGVALRPTLRGGDAALLTRDTRPLLAPRAEASWTIAVQRPGLYLLVLESPTATAGRALLSLPVIVTPAPTLQPRPVADAMLHLDDGPSAAVPGASVIANRTAKVRMAARTGTLLRLRIVNARGQQPVALLLPDLQAMVVAIDSAPAEPFAPGGRQLVLAPGSRIETVLAMPASAGRHAILLHDGKAVTTIAEIDVEGPDVPSSAPLLSPAEPDAETGLVNPRLEGALRVNLAPPAGIAADRIWQLEGALTGAVAPAPAFAVARGRTVVLACHHAAAGSVTLQFEGHHARLLDRLDDGWKPFWLDTVLVPTNETVRLAFVGSVPGRWRIVAVNADPATPRRTCYFDIT